MNAEPTGAMRGVRSYVLRQGRITKAQQQALAELLPRYEIALGAAPLDPSAAFGRTARCIAEIGFGSGECLAASAAADPQSDFIGIEVHRPGIGHLLLELQRREIDNVRIIAHDAIEVLDRWLAPTSLDGLNVFFPDPWPKKRHHKRRLVQPRFLALAARVMRPGALLQLATDWEPYAEQMLAATSDSPYFDNTTAAGGYAAAPLSRLPSRFERRGERLGHRVRDLILRRNDRAGPLER